MQSVQVAVVDSGGANLASLNFALGRLKVNTFLTTDANSLRNASHVILPGVGSASAAMTRLVSLGLVDVIRGLTQPVLGICLGMQLLATHSDEHSTPCIGVIDGVAGLLPSSPQVPVPNMGWCEVSSERDNPLFEGIDDGSHFYFVHSYALAVDRYTIATAMHALPFSAALQQCNFFATQFHPERSAQAGARLLRNFVGLSA